MASSKLNNLIEKYNLTNIIKVIVLLIVLFLVYRIFIETKDYKLPSINNISKNIYEGFENLGNASVYGNVISLLNPTNIPAYSGNTCIFKLSDTFRIDTLKFLLNSGTPATPQPPNSSFYNTNHTIKISYLDGNGNTKYLNGILENQTLLSTNSPPTFTPDSNKKIILSSICDENQLPVYTSQLIFTVTGNNNTIDTIKDSSGYRYIKSFGIYGGDKNLPSLTKYTDICNNLTKGTISLSQNYNSTIPVKPNQNTKTFTQTTDTKIYSFKLNVLRGSYVPSTPIPTTSASTTTTQASPTNTTEMPFNIKINYQNSLYTQNVFTINTPYIVRSDYYSITEDNTTTYIFLTEPIIANSITFTISGSPITGRASTIVPLTIQGDITALYNTPTESDIADYKQNINLLQSKDQNANSNICPSINELVNTQTQTQQICDNMEYQDKVKSEKLRLERNKQYLLKLKDQQDKIEQLNSVIQDLEDKRKARSQASDQIRVLQYQNQKGSASTIRDLANQRLASQENNKLYVDANFNVT